MWRNTSGWGEPPSVSGGEVQARALVARWAEDLGFETFLDEVGNFFIRRPGMESLAAPVMTGSHIDTVPAGGKFDGSYGVVAGLEVLQALKTSKVETRRRIEVVIWANEEGARFSPGQMGSGAFVGSRRIADVLSTVDCDGISVSQALEPILSSTPRAKSRRVGTPAMAAFVEAHIEQGPELEAAGCTIGAVTGIQGRRSFVVDVRGEVLMVGRRQSTRKDALLASMRMIHELDGVMRDPEDRRFTIGAFTLAKRAVSGASTCAVPVDVRHPDNALMEGFCEKVEVRRETHLDVPLRWSRMHEQHRFFSMKRW